MKPSNIPYIQYLMIAIKRMEILWHIDLTGSAVATIIEVMAKLHSV
jgi:hypothetical protein